MPLLNPSAKNSPPTSTTGTNSAMLKIFACFMTLLVILFSPLSKAYSENTAPYIHDRFSPPPEIKRVFHSFVVSFDSKDDDNEDEKPDLLRVPHWVSQEIRKWQPEENLRDDIESWCLETSTRPSWTTDRDLFSTGVAPNDASYKHSGYDRGHMAMKLLSERMGNDAARETFTVLNAVPQQGKFNQGIWQQLEYLTGAWAQVYENIWVLQGPVFMGTPIKWIGDPRERKVAIPDAVYKIIIKESVNNSLDVLAFLYPQLGPGYHGSSKEYRHERFLTSVDEIEKLTGLDFFIDLGTKPNNKTQESVLEKKLERDVAQKLWYPEKVNHRDKLLFINACRG